MSDKFLTCALYKFVSLPDFEILQAPLQKVMSENNVFGTLLLASEGINGTISGLPSDVGKVMSWLQQQPQLDSIDQKHSYHSEIPFYRTKVKLKKEIVTMGVEGIDPSR